MRRTTLVSISAVLVLAILFGGSILPPPMNDTAQSDSIQCSNPNEYHRIPPVAVCFDEGTDPAYMAEWQQRLWGENSLDYNIGGRWSRTATEANTGGLGDGCTITYSFVPDGMNVEGSQSELWSTLTNQFGSQEAWQAQFDSVFSRWGELSGNTYIRVDDDGAGWRDNPGQLGSRGDVRIAMINVDGPSNVLAYNYFPNTGEMVIDASENWGDPQGGFRFFMNVVAHEHGHGLGLYHVCPNNGTKLMEPIYSSARPGPQHDDIRAIQRMYGDNYEPNDAAGAAYDLGFIQDSLMLRYCSLDDDSDSDWYKLTTPAGMAMTVTLIPVGEAYLDGQQLQNGDCEPGVEINSIDDNNVNLILIDQSGSNQLASSATFPPGRPEEIFRYLLPDISSDFYLLINGATANAVQLYELEIRMVDPATPILSGCPLEFGEVESGETSTLFATVENPAVGQTLTLTSISVPEPFTVSPEGPVTLQPGQSQTINVTFNAGSSGLFEEILTIEHDGPGGSLGCDLSAKSVSVDIDFLTGTEVDFGDVQLLTTDSVRIAFRAVGNTNLIVESIEVQGDGFSIDYPTPQSCVAGPLYSMYPRFSPLAEHGYEGMLIVSHSGTTSPDTLSLTGNGTVLGTDNAVVPAEFALHQNYPNPFNPSTTIAFSLPHNSHTLLQIYDIEGRLVRTLIDGEQSVGTHTIEFDARGFAAGVYLYRLQAADRNEVRKMILLK